MNNYTEIMKACSTFTRGFEEVKTYAWNWGNSKRPIKKGMDEIMRSGPDGIAMEYEIQNANLYLLAEVFQDPKAMRQLRTKHGPELIPAGLEVLTFWEEHPAFWCYFTVKEHLEGDLFLITDQMTGEEHTLYSKGISTLQTWKEAEDLSFFCLMQPNPHCLQTVGVIKHYRFLVSDFLYYCSLFMPEEGLEAILHKHFVKFFTLDTIANTPPLKNSIYDMLFIWQPFTLAEFAVEKLGGRWRSARLGSKERFTIEIVDTSMLGLPNLTVFETAPSAMAGTIIKDHDTGELCLLNNTEVAYAFFSALLNRSYPTLQLPKRPMYLISGTLQHVLIGMDLPVPWMKYEDILEYRTPEDRAEEDKRLQWEQLLQEHRQAKRKDSSEAVEDELIEIFLEAQISGKPMDVERIAKAMDMEKEEVESLLARIDAMLENDDLDEFDADEEEFDENYQDIIFTVPSEDTVYELKDLPKPTDIYGGVLYHSLPDSEIFVVSLAKAQEAHRQLLQLVSEEYASEVRQYGGLRSIQRLFTATFEEDFAFPLMNSFIWILQHKGKEYVPVRSYAIEILKWIPSDLLPFFAGQEEFIETFSKFVKRQLCVKGVCTLAKRPTPEEVIRGTYTIKGTDAFFSMVQVRDEEE